MLIVYIFLALSTLIFTVYFAFNSRDFLKFLTGAFFVSSGIQFYLFLAKVSVPLLGTDYVQTPRMSGIRASVHFLFFVVCFYFGFIKKHHRKEKEH